MRIDVWADLVCPWCFIGKRRLQRALEAAPNNNDDVTIVHRAFQLDPSASTHSEPTVDHLAAKYGTTREQALDMMAEVTEVAAGEGLGYRLDQTMTGNTRDVHRFVLWVQDTTPEATQPLLADLYSAYFEGGQRIFTAEDLAPFATRHDLDPIAMREVLEGRDYLDIVHSDQATAREFGASGVPFFVFNDAVGLSGAQPVAAFQQALQQAVGGGTG
jgi:Predicted dithiol-disulfide isomerase involved in polyketide biosynthesis